MNDVEELSAKVRNHPESTFTGEDTQEEVIREALRQELARLDEEAELQSRVEEKKTELRRSFGISEPDDDETSADDAAAKRAELRDRITGGD